MSRMPWLPWFPDDFAGSVRGWSTLQRGGYRDALDAQWTLDGLPAEPQELRRAISATPAEFRCIWPKIEPKFPIGEDGKRRNPRLEHERKRWNRRSEVRSTLGKLGAQKRWGGDGNSHSQPMAIAIDADGNGHSKTMASTSRSISTTRKDPDSEADAAGSALAELALRARSRARTAKWTRVTLRSSNGASKPRR